MSKLKGTILLIISLSLMILLLPKLVYCLGIIVAGITGKFGNQTPYQTGRLMGIAASGLIIYAGLIGLLVMGIRRMKKK
jgi:hypothetical protein